MHKNTLWLIFVILCIYFSLVLSEEFTARQRLKSKDIKDLLRSDITALEQEARTRKHRHHLYSLWGFYGLAVAYLIKIKVVVVAFFVGSAVYLGLRYLWPHKCAGGEIYKEGSVILDHAPYFAHHDHVPYSLDHDHHYDSGSFTSSGGPSYEPYSAYSAHSYAETEGTYPGSSFTGPEGISSDAPTLRHKRNQPEDFQGNKEDLGTLANLARQMVLKEERIGDFMLSFLGLDSNACRRRFICEMEFKSIANPLTSMAFRVIGRSFFAQYTNDKNPLRKANSFEECAAVNVECIFIENNEETEDETAYGTEQAGQNSASKEEVQTQGAQDISLESNDVHENEHRDTLEAKLRRNPLRKRIRGDRYLKWI